MLRTFKTLAIAAPLGLAVATAGAGDMVGVPSPADANIRIETTSVAAGVGVRWGEGTLTLSNGRRFGFTVEGLNLANLGVTRISATGTVHNLAHLDNFAGTYTGVGASATVAAGRGIVRMKNQDGVVIRLRSTSQGVGLKLAAEGVRIKLRPMGKQQSMTPMLPHTEVE